MSAAMMNTNNLFEGMDDLDSAPVRGESVATKVAKATAPMIVCPRCAGRKVVTWGYVNIRSGPCNQCKGTGQVRADWQKRREAFKKGEQTKAQNLATKVAQFKQDHPAEYAYMLAGASRGNDFANSLLNGLNTYGRLTDGQLAAVTRGIAKDAEFKTKREAEAVARGVDTHGTGHNKLVVALNTAKKGMKRQPSLICGDIDFQRAPDHGKNPGAVYVKSRQYDTYLGKISPDGLFQPSRECTEETKARVAVIMLDPLAAAIEHGKITGECACCKRRLTDPVSVANGIGPICAANFGF